MNPGNPIAPYVFIAALGVVAGVSGGVGVKLLVTGELVGGAVCLVDAVCVAFMCASLAWLTGED